MNSHHAFGFRSLKWATGGAALDKTAAGTSGFPSSAGLDRLVPPQWPQRGPSPPECTSVTPLTRGLQDIDTVHALMRSLVQPPPPPTSAAAATGPAATSEATSEATSMADEQKIDEDPPQARRGLTNLFGLLGRT